MRNIFKIKKYRIFTFVMIFYSFIAKAQDCPSIVGSIKTITSTSPENCETNVYASPVSQSISSGETTAINLTTDKIGTTFSWTVVQTGLTGASSGNGNIIAQTLINNSSEISIATYTITPKLNNCKASSIIVIVTVKPTYKNTSKSGIFTKNDCAPGGTGSAVTYTVQTGSYSASTQAEADEIAQNAVNANGQTYANTNGSCTFSSVGFNGSFVKNNCEEGGVGSSVPFNQAAGAVTSTVSQADADTRGLDKFNTDGQVNANSNSSTTCTFYSTAKSITANKDDCGIGKGGAAVTYTVPQGKYSSTISQSNADVLAQNDVNLNSQTYINATGTCSPETYSVSMDDYDSIMSKIWLSVSCNSASHMERSVSVTIRYQYQINKIASINKYFVLPANSTFAMFTVTLNFFGEPMIYSYTIN